MSGVVGMAGAVIEVEGLGRRFGTLAALDDVTFTVPRGQVLGLIGPNGAGKTTLIQHLLGLLRAQSGRVRVFGDDPVTRPARVLARIGCVSEARDLPGWMRVDELLAYMRAFYPSWDDALTAELCGAFALDPRQRVRSLSRGQHVRAALVVALAPRPELLVLDEPSSGLDPVVRRDVLEAILRTVADDGRTVLFSSHLLDEVERMSDRLVLIDHGRIVADGSFEVLAARHLRVTVRASGPRPVAPSGATVLERQVEADREQWLVRLDTAEPEGAWTAPGLDVVDTRPARLDEIFLAYTRRPSA